jgi:ribonuclease BN (tRNA processing enzyme)
MSFKVTVLGSSGGYAGAGKACSGYLLECGERTLVLDLGPGALSNLLKYLDPGSLGGLALSHLHYDHYMDIYGLLTARRFWPRSLDPLPLLAPPGAAEHIGMVIYEESRPVFMETLEITELDPGVELQFAGFEVRASAVNHIDNSFAFRVSAEGRSVCYSGDTDRSDALLELAAGADLFICESTFTSELPVKMPGHLSGREAGQIAEEAGVRALMLTHLWPTLDGTQAVEDAGAEYDGNVDLAIEGLTLYVGPYPVAT